MYRAFPSHQLNASRESEIHRR